MHAWGVYARESMHACTLKRGFHYVMPIRLFIIIYSVTVLNMRVLRGRRRDVTILDALLSLLNIDNDMHAAAWMNK